MIKNFNILLNKFVVLLLSHIPARPHRELLWLDTGLFVYVFSWCA